MLLPACSVSALAPGDVIRIEPDVTGGVAVAVFRTEYGLYAVDDSCTHQDAALSDGWIEDCWVECPLHAACFDLRTGAPLGPPAEVPLRTHRVVVVDGTVHVEIGVCADPGEPSAA